MTKQSLEKWIIGVRKLVTDEFPDFNVGQYVKLFRSDSDQVDLLFTAYHKGKTPAEAYAYLKKVYGPDLGV